MEGRITNDPNAPTHHLYHVTLEILDEDETGRAIAAFGYLLTAASPLLLEIHKLLRCGDLLPLL